MDRHKRRIDRLRGESDRRQLPRLRIKSIDVDALAGSSCVGPDVDQQLVACRFLECNLGRSFKSHHQRQGGGEESGMPDEIHWSYKNSSGTPNASGAAQGNATSTGIKWLAFGVPS